MKFFLILSLLVSCHKDVSPNHEWVLQLVLPRGIASGPARQRNFIARVSRIEIEVAAPDGTTRDYYAMAGSLGHIHLADIAIDPEAGSYRFVARVWDQLTDGTPRATPALEGRAHFDRAELASAKDRRLSMPLHLRVDEREYD